MNPTAETSALLFLLVRAMVRNREAVEVTPVPVAGGTCFEIRAADSEIGKLIGTSGRIARSLGQIVQCIGMENGAGYFDVRIIDRSVQQKAPTETGRC